MKASDLIKALQHKIQDCGDRNVKDQDWQNVYGVSDRTDEGQDIFLLE